MRSNYKFIPENWSMSFPNIDELYSNYIIIIIIIIIITVILLTA